MNPAAKLAQLKSLLSRCDKVAVAFSGGVDSTFLLAVAAETFSPNNLLALTATAPLFPARECAASAALAEALGVRQVFIDCNPLELDEVASNPPLRCYHCKHHLFVKLREQALAMGFTNLLDGSNLDDLEDYRPGRKALEELGIASPLLEAKLTKTDIRTLSRQAGLATADKPALACLASRFPYGTQITPERLQQVERCEDFMRQHGFRTFRVRYHGETARIEVHLDEMPGIMKDGVRDALLTAFKAAGFTYVALDLQGYRTGSLNENL